MTVIVRFLRVLICLLLASCATFFIALFAILCSLFGGRYFANTVGVRVWCVFCGYVCRLFLGIRVHRKGGAEIDPGRPCIIIGNHPQVFEMFAVMNTIRPFFPKRVLLPVMKQELMKTPFGWGAKHMGGVPIDRENGVSAITKIRKWVLDFSYHTSPGIVIYPDGTRNNPKKRKDVCRRLSEKLSGTTAHDMVAQICSVTIPPRAGGVSALLQGLDAPQCLLVVVANNASACTIRDLVFDPPTDVYVLVKLVSIQSVSSAELRDELFRLWCTEVVPFMKKPHVSG